MSEQKKYLLRKVTGDQVLEEQKDIFDLFSKGQCKSGDFLYDFSTKKWSRVAEDSSVAALFSKPQQAPEKKLVYYMAPGQVAILQGPFSLKEIQQKIQARELCGLSWVFVEGDKEWRQMKSVKALLDILPALPQDHPVLPSTTNVPKEDVVPVASSSEASSVSLLIEREEQTKAFSALGLSLEESKTEQKLDVAPGSPPPIAKSMPSSPPEEGISLSVESAPHSPPPLPSQSGVVPPVVPPQVVSPAPGSPPPAPEKDQSSYDGLTVEIPVEPIWLIKQANSEAVSGPFRFLDVVKFLESGKLSKNDKISKVGTNRFVKIQQQYEFNVKFNVESVMEKGVEIQKILIKRRHPRVPYITGIQIVGKQGLHVGDCVNISAGGILMEVPKAEFQLGDIFEIKILPGLIPKAITCNAMVIGRIPKIPPAYAVRFENLKNEDKEAIEYFIHEALKREMTK